jgi:hypothetical protein
LHLVDDSGVVWRKATDAGEGPVSLVQLARADEEARSLGENEHAAEEDERPSELNGDRDAVAAGVIALTGSVVDDCCNKEADSDSPLISTDDGTTNPFRSGLRLVERN